MHISCGGKSHGNWRSGKEHAAHLAHHQHHTGHRWGSYFDSMSLPQNVGCDTKSETSCTTDDITRQVEKHVFGKDVRQMSDHSLFGRRSTTLVISRAFAVVFSRVSFRIRCPVLHVSIPEVLGLGFRNQISYPNKYNETLLLHSSQMT